MTDQNPGQTPAQWLIDQFESTDADGICRADQRRTIVVQPMYRLKSIMDGGNAMRVTATDYRHSHRRWL